MEKRDELCLFGEVLITYEFDLDNSLAYHVCKANSLIMQEHFPSFSQSMTIQLSRNYE